MALPINVSSLVMELRTNLTEINRQLDAIREAAEGDEFSVYAMKNSAGDFIMAPILLAKSQCLSAISALQTGPKR